MKKHVELPRFLLILIIVLAIVAGASFALRDTTIPATSDSDARVDLSGDRWQKPSSSASAVPEATDASGKLRAIPGSGKAPLTVTFLPVYQGPYTTISFGDDTRENVTCADAKDTCTSAKPVVHTYKMPGTYTVFYRNGNDIVAKFDIVAR